MGKGSKPRPISDKEKYQSEWDRIFKKKVKDGKEDNSERT